MKNLADHIEAYLSSLVQRSDDGVLVIRRSNLAEYFQCVPSQITYVLDTRFTLARGYLVESRRGGGGYVRIVRLKSGSMAKTLEKLSNTGDSGVTQWTALQIIARLEEDGFVTSREAALMKGAVSKVALAESHEDRLRARILQFMMASLMDA